MGKNTKYMGKTTTYSLVNPVVNGLNTDVVATSSDEAAGKVWNVLETYINGNTPQFYITLRGGKSNKLYHYCINERVENNKVITAYKKVSGMKVNPNKVNEHLKRASSINDTVKSGQTGGGDSSSSSSDSELEYYYYANYGKYPINHMLYNMSWYSPLISNIFIPNWTRVGYFQVII